MVKTPIRFSDGTIHGTERMPKQVTRCECGDHAFTPLTKWGVTLVSVEDVPLLEAQSWCLWQRPSGLAYAVGSDAGKKVSLHRKILRTPEDKDTDHRNSNGLDNRRPNIRVLSRSENNYNRKATRASCGFRGVVFHHASGRWRGYVQHKGRQHSAGYYDTPEKAAKARDQLCIDLGLATARVNF